MNDIIVPMKYLAEGFTYFSSLWNMNTWREIHILKMGLPKIDMSVLLVIAHNSRFPLHVWIQLWISGQLQQLWATALP